MTPTREQFKELMTFIRNAQEKEDKVNDVDAFYDYLVEMANKSNHKTEE